MKINKIHIEAMIGLQIKFEEEYFYDDDGIRENFSLR